MRIIVCKDAPELNRSGADQIAAVIGAKPNAALVLATGNSPVGMYSELGARTARGDADASRLHVFQLDEYFGLADDHPLSLWAQLDRTFIQPMRVPLQNVVRLRGDMLDWRDNCKRYDERIAAVGGFDLAVLGIGPNGHLGYNEPGSSHAHAQTRALLLSEASSNSSLAYGWEKGKVPTAAITCGLVHLLAARTIVLVASGAHKRAILEQALFGPIGPECPASYLQTVADRVVLICDEAAAPQAVLEKHGGKSTSAPAVPAPAVVPARAVRDDLILGVDGGNSKTVAVLAQKNGRIIGWGRGGCGDMYGAHPEGALQSVTQAVQGAFSVAGLPECTVNSAVFSMAGADWPEDYELLTKMFGEARFASDLRVYNDSAGALRAGSPQGWGVGVVCGTWSATAARARGGTQWVRSAWQPSGGGGGLAHDALTAVYKAYMGMGPATKLTEKALKFFHVESVEEILHLFTNRDGPKPQAIHRLAPHVFDTAVEGDPVACTVITEQGYQLGEVAYAMARQVGIADKAFPLVLAGGVFRHKSPLLANSLTERVRSQAPQVKVFMSRLEPVAGAVMLAAELAKARVNTRMRDRLEQTMPPASFFST